MCQHCSCAAWLKTGSCVQFARSPFRGNPVASRLRKLVAGLHGAGAGGHRLGYRGSLDADVRGHPRLAVRRRDNVPRSQPRRAAISVTFHPTSSILLADEFARVRPVQHRADASAGNFGHGQDSLRSVIVDQVHGLTVLEAEHHAPVAGHTDAPPARRRVADALPLAGGTGCAGAVAPDPQAPARDRPARAAPAVPSA